MIQSKCASNLREGWTEEEYKSAFSRDSQKVQFVFISSLVSFPRDSTLSKINKAEWLCFSKLKRCISEVLMIIGYIHGIDNYLASCR